MIFTSRTLSPLPVPLLSFILLQASIRSLEWSHYSIKASISVREMHMSASRCVVFKLTRRLFFIRLKLENPHLQSTLVAGRTAIIQHKLQLGIMWGQKLDKILVCTTRFNVDDIIHKLCLVHVLYKPIFVHKKAFKLIKNTVHGNKVLKLTLQCFEFSEKRWNKLPFFVSA